MGEESSETTDSSLCGLKPDTSMLLNRKFDRHLQNVILESEIFRELGWKIVGIDDESKPLTDKYHLEVLLITWAPMKNTKTQEERGMTKGLLSSSTKAAAQIIPLSILVRCSFLESYF